jgi:SAM-dependent MidA family methyltransferase
MNPPPDGRLRETPLASVIKARIARDGPISVADYMDVCLQDAEHGYYRGRAAIGASGDFVTAPEISQVFGEIIGLWCAVVWQQMGAPPALRLIELGPGRGTLVRDALRAARVVPAFRAALRVELIESNATLAGVQREALESEGVAVSWSQGPSAGDGPVIVIANEFLDTLPAEQWIFRNGAWHQRLVGLDASDRLAFVDRPLVDDVKLPSELPGPADGDIFETRWRAFDALGRKLASLGAPLAGLFIDYGHTVPGYGDTLQAVASHRFTNPLEAPGEADLTAQVDFASFREALHRHGVIGDGPVPQAEFLGQLGAVERASRLMAANPQRVGELEAGFARLTAPAGMGSRFQAMGIRSVDIPLLPAFGPVDGRRD